MNVSRIPTWITSFQGVWLLTWRSSLAVRKAAGLGLGLAALPVLVFLTLEPGRTEPYLHWTIDFYFWMVVPLYVLSVCGGMIREEVQSDTLSFLLTRPVSRARLFLVKFTCHVLWLQILGVVALALLIGVGVLRDIPEVIRLAFILFPVQFLAILAYGALSGLLGLLHQRYMVLGILYGFVVEMGIGRIPTNINNLSMARHFRTLLGNNSSIYEAYSWSPEKSWLSILIPIGVAVAFVALSAVIFTFKEYHHSEEMQK